MSKWVTFLIYEILNFIILPLEILSEKKIFIFYLSIRLPSLVNPIMSLRIQTHTHQQRTHGFNLSKYRNFVSDIGKVNVKWIRVDSVWRSCVRGGDSKWYRSDARSHTQKLFYQQYHSLTSRLLTKVTLTPTACNYSTEYIALYSVYLYTNGGYFLICRILQTF